MKVLVTGASGFLGTHVSRELSRRGHTVLSFDVDSPESRLGEYVRERMPVMGEFYNILVRNVFSRGHTAVRLFNPMENVTIENVFLSQKARSAVLSQSDTELKNVVIRNIHGAPGSEIRSLFDFYKVSGNLKLSGVYVDSADYLERLADSSVKIDYEDVNVTTLKKGRTLTLKKGEPKCRPTFHPWD